MAHNNSLIIAFMGARTTTCRRTSCGLMHQKLDLGKLNGRCHTLGRIRALPRDLHPLVQPHFRHGEIRYPYWNPKNTVLKSTSVKTMDFRARIYPTFTLNEFNRSYRDSQEFFFSD